jgi:transcriptional regulator with XRE-family HTH domain
MTTTWTAEGIKALRLSLGLSQSQFAQLIGCHVRAVSQWERGKRTPTGLYAKALDTLERSAMTWDAAVHVGVEGTTIAEGVTPDGMPFIIYDASAPDDA